MDSDLFSQKPSAANLEKRIKKNIYGKLQTIKVTVPPGSVAIAFSEIEVILMHLWYPQKTISQMTIIDNDIYISDIHMFAIVEVLMRSRTISDIRLIIFQGKTFTKGVFEKKCSAIPWEYYFNQSMSVKIKVNSVGSHIFHETSLKKILHEIINPHVNKIENGGQYDATTTLYADLYHDRLTLSISLAGEFLYKRGYRSVLSASAPLREDAAACFMQKAFEFFKEYNKDFSPHTLLIPFSGTGTFAFEFLQRYLKISPVLFERTYAMQKMPLFRSENFNFLLKKARDQVAQYEQKKSHINIICIDHAEKANEAFLKNISIFNAVFKKNGWLENHLLIMNDDFLKMSFEPIQNFLEKNIFMPLNPPYGIRMSKQNNIVQLYKNIAKKINELSLLTKKNNNNILGFILCPNEETWRVFLKNINNAKTDTYHFNQGGIDIRVCQFIV
jgi:23S rRNA G2445 N2-methylase RlmL